MATGSSTIGGGIASKVAGVVADASAATRIKMLKPTHDLMLATQDSFFRLMGGEIHTTMGPLFLAVADNPDAPPWVARTFTFLAREHGQWQAFLANSAGGAAVSSGLIPLLNNELAPVTQNLIAQNPNFVIDVGTAANLAARNLVSASAMATEARRQGISATRFGWLVTAAEQGMAPGDALTAVNRGVISATEAIGHLRRAGLTDAAAADTLSLRRLLISPPTAAELVNFGVMTAAQAQRVARDHGMSDDDMDRLILGGGQAPGVEFLLSARNRGIINDTRLNRGIVQSPIRNEWFDVVRDMRTVPPGTTAALDAFVQNLLSETQARAVAADNGLDLQHFGWLAESAGRPFGVEQMGELFNRGEITAAQFRQAFLESNVKNKYVDLIFPLARRLPTMEMTTRMVREGAISVADGIRNLRALGFTQADAAALADLAQREQATATRDLSVTMVRELFEEQAISEREASDALQALGYSSENAAWVLAIGELRRARRLQALAVSRVRSRFVAHRIDQRETENALDALRVPPAERGDLIDSWAIEREVSVPRLTVSQVQQALRRGLLNVAGASARLLDLGYDEQDAAILVQLAAPTG